MPVLFAAQEEREEIKCLIKKVLNPEGFADFKADFYTIYKFLLSFCNEQKPFWTLVNLDVNQALTQFKTTLDEAQGEFSNSSVQKIRSFLQILGLNVNQLALAFRRADDSSELPSFLNGTYQDLNKAFNSVVASGLFSSAKKKTAVSSGLFL